MDIKLDYTITDVEKRIALVNQIIENAPPQQLTQHYLQILSDYIVLPIEKQDKREKTILTSNRMVTINKRETSYQGLVDKLENGEDGIYNMMIDNNKNTILSPKISISAEQATKIPGMHELQESIKKIEELEKNAMGKKKYLLKKQLIEMRQQQYTLKMGFSPPIFSTKTSKSISQMEFDTKIEVNENGEIIDNSPLSLFNPEHISALLCNFRKLENQSENRLNSDCWCMIQDLKQTIEKVLKDHYPLYYDLLWLKIDGYQNTEIQTILKERHGVNHSIEYISCLWRNKIPKLLADYLEQEYLLWYYTTQQYGKWKRCSRCGQVKLAHNRFFSKNKSSKDGWYSICKACRNAKSKEVKKV